ncbi:MAG: hypothetical protein PQJ46_04350 [Spirochaetales bacterium]|nr:hypothetical protein [Spirochaetales bacterium]
MADRGDIFDLGTNEYLEYIESFDDENDYVIHYTREAHPSLKELKLHRLIPKNSLDGEYRKIGPNEKKRLLTVYSNALQKKSEELEV